MDSLIDWYFLTDGDNDGEMEELALGEVDGLTEGLTDCDIDPDGLIEGLTDGDALLTKFKYIQSILK